MSLVFQLLIVLATRLSSTSTTDDGADCYVQSGKHVCEYEISPCHRSNSAQCTVKVVAR